MEFGVPKEVRDLERRVGITPAGVDALSKAGHTVYVERDAGAGAGFSDEHYRSVGAQIVYSAAEAFGRADMVVKVARPAKQEHSLFRDGQVIAAFMHLAVASPDLHQALSQHRITALAFEEIQDADGTLPVLVPMSEAAGRLAPIIAGQLLTSTAGGRGILLNGLPGVPRATVIILGAGTLGRAAAQAFVGIGAQVIVLDNDMHKLRAVDDLFSGTVSTMVANEYNLNRVVSFADVVLGAVLRAGERAPVLITRAMVRRMRPGAVIIDFSIDQGGCVETSRPMSLRDSTFVVEGVTHFCVPNATAMVARTASHALTNSSLPYLLEVGEHGLEKALARDPSLSRGIKVYQGQIASQRLAAAMGQEVEVDLAGLLQRLQGSAN